jgi:hypothetical protein
MFGALRRDATVCMRMHAYVCKGARSRRKADRNLYLREWGPLLVWKRPPRTFRDPLPHRGGGVGVHFPQNFIFLVAKPPVDTVFQPTILPRSQEPSP